MTAHHSPRTGRRTTALARREPSSIAERRKLNQEYASKLAAASKADATLIAYASDLAHWEQYATTHDVTIFPVSVDDLREYIGWLAREETDAEKKARQKQERDGPLVPKKVVYSISTIRRRCAALAYLHKASDVPSPTWSPKVRELLQGLAKKRRKKPDKKTALTGALVRAMVAAIDTTLSGELDPDDEWRARRDRTVLLVGLTVGMRRSEIAAMEWDHLTWEEGGVAIFIPDSKTDKKGEGQYVALPRVPGATLCPVTALEEWETFLDAQGEDGVSVFHCSGKTINRIVQRHVAHILGEDESLDYGAHSFRSGFATEAYRSGARLEDIMQQTRHRSRDVAQGYIQHLEQGKNPAVHGVLKRLQGDPTK
jgi:integrase